MRCLIGLAIAGLACGLSGCTSVEGRGFRPEPELVAVTLWVPPNYLSGTPWPLDLLSGRDAEALLRREFTFRANDSYSLAHLCKEVTRVTGKRIVCLPPAAQSFMESEGRRWRTIQLPPLGWADAYGSRRGPLCRLPLHAVLSQLAGAFTQIYRYRAAGDERTYVWTAWMGRDAIFLFRLPGEVPRAPRREETAASTKPGTCGCARPGFLREIAVVLPRNWPDKGAVMYPALMSRERLEAFLGRELRLDAGTYTLRSLSGHVERLTGREIVWIPEVDSTDKTWQQFDAPIVQISTGPAEKQGGLSAVTVAMSVSEAMDLLIGNATEMGLGRDPPDREIWAAIVAEKHIILVSVPDPCW